MKRYRKIVFEVSEDVELEFFEDKDNILVVKIGNVSSENTYHEYLKTLDELEENEKKPEEIFWPLSLLNFSENYSVPPIPNGYRYVEGSWENGYTIENIKDKNQWVWVPVGALKADGMLDEKFFNQKFGRRNFMGEEFEKEGFFEPINPEFFSQIESVYKYGGFYIARFSISKSDESGMAKSVPGRLPWVNIDFDEAKKQASKIDIGEEVRTHLMYGAEYDSVLAWLISSGAKSVYEVSEDSSSWGNYIQLPANSCQIALTGANGYVNNISDFAGNVVEWTQEIHQMYHVIRGGHFRDAGNEYPVASRKSANPREKSDYISFRAALWIK